MQYYFSNLKIIDPDPHSNVSFYEKNTLFYRLLSWMGLDYLKARIKTNLRKQFTFYH